MFYGAYVIDINAQRRWGLRRNIFHIFDILRAKNSIKTNVKLIRCSRKTHTGKERGVEAGVISVKRTKEMMKQIP